MIDDRQRAQAEQAIAATAELFPPMLWQLYRGCREQGFSDSHALFLTAEYLKAVVMRPSQPDPPQGDGA